MLTDINRLKYRGVGVKIFEMAKLVAPERISIAEGTQIDDFCFMYAGQGISIGRFNHICSFVTVIGGGEFITEDYVGISAGCRIVTGTQHYEGGARMVPVVPKEQQKLIVGKVYLCRDSFLGSNVIVYPGVTIGEGAIIGAGGVVTKSVDPWTINVGAPVRVIGQRPKVIYD